MSHSGLAAAGGVVANSPTEMKDDREVEEWNIQTRS
jgi:hypothetical protein